MGGHRDVFFQRTHALQCHLYAEYSKQNSFLLETKPRLMSIKNYVTYFESLKEYLTPMTVVRIWAVGRIVATES